MIFRLLTACGFGALAIASPQAVAWTRPGHMVTAAIAWEEIAERKPELLSRLGELLLAHPDRGAFQVAIDRTQGLEQARRLFLECARWPDDSRGTVFDHPSWHTALTGVVAEGAPPGAGNEVMSGQAAEAFALNYQVLASGRASAAERAQALCWVLHIAGDIHQPLHASELFSAEFPEGDAAGSRGYVTDPVSGEAITLHWLWDDSVIRSGKVEDVDARAAELKSRFPKTKLTEIAQSAAASQFDAWRRESYALGVSTAYGGAVNASPTAERAPRLTDESWNQIRMVAERRVTVAGYRMADLVIAALGGEPSKGVGGNP